MRLLVAKLFICLCCFGLLSCKQGQNLPLNRIGASVSSVSFQELRTAADIGILSLFSPGGGLVYFWAPWCAVCKAEFDDLQMLAQSLGGDFKVLLVATLFDDLKMIAEIGELKALSSPNVIVAVDHDGIAQKRFKITGVPESFLISRDGRLLSLPLNAGMPSVRVIGPQNWASANTQRVIKASLASAHGSAASN